MSLSLEPDVYEESIEWTEINSTVAYVTKVKIVVPYETVHENHDVDLLYQAMPIKLLIMLIKKSKYGTVVSDGDYYTITFSSKLFGVDYFYCFRCIIDGEFSCFVKFSNIGNIINCSYTVSYTYTRSVTHNFAYFSFVGAFIFIDKKGDLSYQSIKCTINGTEMELQPIKYNSDDHRMYYVSLNYSLDEFVSLYDKKKTNNNNCINITTNTTMAKIILFSIYV